MKQRDALIEAVSYIAVCVDYCAAGDDLGFLAEFGDKDKTKILEQVDELLGGLHRRQRKLRNRVNRVTTIRDDQLDTVLD
jgi:hypothetical protein